MIKTVTVFSNGDSRAIKTWSNVPYFFTQTLIAKGIKVHRVDLSESLRLKWWFDRTVMRLIRRIAPKTSYCYFRSVVHFLDVRQRTRFAIRSHTDSDAYIFLTFSFSSVGLTTKPTILFCDWTYYYQLGHFKGKQPDAFEGSSIRRENQQISQADLVISLFPMVSRHMQTHYKSGNICYLGNVVNSIMEPDKTEILKAKTFSRDILFIGRKHYMEGAKTLIAAWQQLKIDYPSLVLHIVGMDENDFSDLPSGVKCYGYLDKAIPEQKDVFYSLLIKAKVLVNTTPQWGSFSAMLEAMHFYNPIITTPFSEWFATFGENILFGYYCQDNTVEAVYSKLKNVFETNNYESLCISAHEAVKEFSWDNYMDKVLDRIYACSEQRRLSLCAV